MHRRRILWNRVSMILGAGSLLYFTDLLRNIENRTILSSKVVDLVLHETLQLTSSDDINQYVDTNNPVYLQARLHIPDSATTDEFLRVSAKCVNLRRHVQMYQWEEYT